MPERASPDVDVVLYGATGYTGQLIAHALSENGASYALAGRDAGKLDALAKTLPDDPPTIVAPLDDAGALRRMAARARVVLSAAGPFMHMGPPVLRAALAAGAHFADITGEQAFLRWALDQDAEAKRAGVTIVNAMGFDVVPSDFAAARAAEGLDAPALVDIAIASNAGISGGTRRSMAASAGTGWWYDRGRWRRGTPGRFVRDFDMPAPLGPKPGVFIPWGDVVTAPRSTNARRVRTFFTMNKKSRAFGLRVASPFLALASRTPWFKRDPSAITGPSGKGPDAEKRAKARFTILAEAHAPDGRVQRAVSRGRDPYGLTGAAAAYGAMRLAAGDVDATGVLTPSQAFDRDAFTRALAPFEFTCVRLEDA